MAEKEESSPVSEERVEVKARLSEWLEEIRRVKEKLVGFQPKVRGRYDVMDIDEYNRLNEMMNTLKSKMERDTDSDTKNDVMMIRDHRVHTLWQISMVIRHDFRCAFDASYSDQCGYFLDNHMNDITHQYWYALDYPSGDHVLTGHTDRVRALAVSDDGRYVFTGARDNRIIVWDLLSNHLFHKFEAHSDNVLGLDYYPGYLVSCSRDQSIRIWNSYSLQLIHTLEEHSDLIVCVRFNQTGDRIVSGSDDNTVRLWSVETGECLKVFTGHTDSVNTVRFAMYGDVSVILSGASDNSLRVWNSETRDVLHNLVDAGVSRTHGLAFNCDFTLLARIRNTGFTVYTWPDFEIVRCIQKRQLRGCFHPVLPNIFAVGDKFNTVQIYDVSVSDECLHSLKGHTQRVVNVAFTPDGRRLISISNDDNVGVWDVSFLMPGNQF